MKTTKLAKALVNTINKIKGPINFLTRSISSVGGVLGLFFGSLSMQFLGLCLKFFQTLDNIGNYELLNISYTPIMSMGFDLIGKISESPDFDGKVILNANSKEILERFPDHRYKIGDSLDSGYTILTNPSGTVFTIVRII